MKKSTLYILIAIIALLAVGAAYLLLQNHKQQQAMGEMEEMFNFEKEELEEEYSELAMQYDGYQIGQLHNDSLVELLSQEKQRVQDLLEELRITKATNARRINELKKELATVRGVMVQYVHQIDSLDRTNKRLVAENQEVRQKYEEVSIKAEQLEQERTKLTEVVERASMMEVGNVVITLLNSTNRKTTRIAKAVKIQIDYTVMKNITTEPGMKTLYLRLTRPDGEVLMKSPNNLFNFENGQIEYSLKKEFEYTGEETSDVLYWTIEEVLQVGTYNADFFIDGNLVQSMPFRMEK